jgi:urease accessory protein
MYAPTSRSEQAVTDGDLQRLCGEASVSFAPSGLADLRQKAPCRILFPRSDHPWPEAVLLNTAGGVTGGDRLTYGVGVRDGASAVATTQAAEKIYRAIDDVSVIETRLNIAGDAELHWLPQETIVFDRARLRRSTNVEIAANGRLLALDWLILGRQAHGETLAQGAVHERWRIQRDGRLIWADDFRLGDDIRAQTARPAILDKARAQATLIYVAADAADMLSQARSLLEKTTTRAGATAFEHLMLVRFLSQDPDLLRHDVTDFVTQLRNFLAGRIVPMPRVWSC